MIFFKNKRQQVETLNDHVDTYSQQLILFSAGLLLCISCLILQLCLRLLNPGRHQRFTKILHA